MSSETERYLPGVSTRLWRHDVSDTFPDTIGKVLSRQPIGFKHSSKPTRMLGSDLIWGPGGTGFFFSGVGVHVLTIIPELKLVLVLRMDTDRKWAHPPRQDNARLFSMITAARTGAKARKL